MANVKPPKPLATFFLDIPLDKKFKIVQVEIMGYKEFPDYDYCDFRMTVFQSRFKKIKFILVYDKFVSARWKGTILPKNENDTHLAFCKLLKNQFSLETKWKLPRNASKEKRKLIGLLNTMEEKFREYWWEVNHNSTGKLF